jgi:hypothetical protein
MTAEEIYKVLDDAGIDFEVVESFEGARWLRFVVDETEGEDE